MTHVPYRGLGPAMNDIVGGHIDAIATSVIGVLPYVQSNKARALATLDTERSEQLPDVPTTVELGYTDLVMPQWYGLLAPAGLPADVRTTLESQALSVLRSPEVVKMLALSGVANPKGTAEFRTLLDFEYKRWPGLLPKFGITAQ
jgi:tripartite-type tricarboxylate transporter receptor subunit TctC